MGMFFSHPHPLIDEIPMGLAGMGPHCHPYSPIALRLSSLKRRRNCLTGLNLGSMLRVCSVSSLGTPGMSKGFHAKMSRFSRMNSMSVLSYFGSRLALILNYWDESPGTKSIVFSCWIFWYIICFFPTLYAKVIVVVHSPYTFAKHVQI